MIELIIGLGIAIFLLSYFAINLPDEHILLKLLMYSVILALLILIPKTIMDTNEFQVCDNVINSTLTDGNLTSYSYAQVCYTEFINNSKTNTIFFKAIVWFNWVFWIYMFIYINWWFWLGKFIKETRTWGKVQRGLKHGN